MAIKSQIYSIGWGLVLFLVMFLHSCKQEKESKHYKTIICNVDTSILNENRTKFLFYQEDTLFYHVNVGGYLNTQEAHTGTHSVLLTGEKNFALSSVIKKLDNNEHFIISIWRKDKSKKSALVVQGDKTSGLYIAQKEAIEQGTNGWERLEIEVEIPPNIKQVRFYVWRINADSAFFDDLEIHQLPPKEYPAYADRTKLHLYFSNKKMKKFEAKRYQAFEDGILISDGEWMKGIMSDENNVMPIKSRLKGDWLDHLHGEKWSLRVKMRDEYTFKRMRVFSLQNPITRYYLHEYLTHQLFSEEDALTTRYGFIPVYLNGKSLGIYAWEEHFTKQLIEYNLRREGPILKFDEDPFWRMQQLAKVHKKWVQLPYYETSRVIAFGMKKILSKPVLAQQFHIAQSLMYQYKNQKAPIEELFNLDALAKYRALVDIVNGRHGKAWHNQRMYYNPVLCKLEPINFDNYTEHYPTSPPATINALLVVDKGEIPAENQLSNHIFSSRKLLEVYLKYLEYYSNEENMKQFIEGEREKFTEYEQLIQREFPRYKFNDKYLLENAEQIRKKLPIFKKKLADGFFDEFHVTSPKIVTDTGYYADLIPNYINTFYSKTETDDAEILFENYSGRTIEILGLANKKKKLVYRMDQHVFLPPFVETVRDTSFAIPYLQKATYLVFKANEHQDLLYSELSLWQKNTGLSPYQKLLHSSNYKSTGLFDERGDSLIVRSGKYQLDKKILIPNDKILVFEPQVELDIIKNATIISHAALIMNGTKEQPIHIYSSDSTANGFSLLQAKGISILNYVTFSHINTLSYEGWNLTGAVNFYESDVKITNCTFENNHCEDALNIVRSNFLVSRSQFLNIFSDAFDSDFCTGTLEKSTFQYVGNDAIDFSTSQIKIDNCDIKYINDKGISGGEGSTLEVINTNISDCNIGAASKDLSKVDLQNVQISNCNYGLLALQKKPEYGPATLHAKKLSITNCTKKYLIEKLSTLQLNGRKIEGTRKNVAKLFY